jgi:hypothetical protein
MTGQADLDFLQEQGFPSSSPHPHRIWDNLCAKYLRTFTAGELGHVIKNRAEGCSDIVSAFNAM